jgi:DNA-binding XRE family transcriptional regulator
MNADVKLVPGRNGCMEINLSIPMTKVDALLNALRGILPLAGLKLRRINEDGEELFSSEEIFPDGCPAMALRGLRVLEDITQSELASRLGISQNMVSEMENGKRSITPKMAKRIAEEFKAPYKAFL